MATILVIDDERMICDLMRAVLAAHGHDVLVATSGPEGLDLFRQRKPRFTLLDLRMPLMDGIEVLQQIRKMDSQTGVIMLTGAGTDALEIRARGLGVTDFLRKGLPLERLLAVMERALQQPTGSTGKPRTGEEREEIPAESPKGESILVVDDEAQVRGLLSRFLTQQGYHVRVAPDGQTAVTLVAEAPPRLVILDINMPGMDGLDVMRALQGMNYTGGILGLTASPEDLRQEMLDLGGVDVMGKPIDLEKLLLAVQVGCLLAAP